jgi:hypothetical protein
LSSETPDEIDLARIRTIPLSTRSNKVAVSELAATPQARQTFREFYDSLPDILEARSLRAVVDAIAHAKREGRAIICMMGGHVVKTGLTPVLIELMRRGAITHLASNGSTVIHDFELACFGGTSEDVEAGLQDGSFGMAEETGRAMNEAITTGAANGWGMGESLARALEGRTLENPEQSLLLNARRLSVGFTVHAAIGAEIIHQHPAADGAALGATSHTDFKRLAGQLAHLDEGGVVLNLGSAVLMPEVFLKALTVCRNVNEGRPRNFITADFDMVRHYRPRVNVVERPTRSGGHGYQIIGHHEIMIPLLAWGVLERLEEE